MTDIAKVRLASQHLVQRKLHTAKEIVSWMGAMQAQDYAMVKWAVGMRLLQATVDTIHTAIDQGDIFRTHVLRPTWHLVSADDIHWMLELSAPQIKALLKSRHKQLEITDKVISKSNNVITKTLSQSGYATREKLVAELEKAHIATADNRAAHLLMWAELEGVICNGKTIEKKQTYALLSERIPRKETITRDEALARLAKKYFLSHCPATLQDFIWWSGLSVRDARRALGMIQSEVVAENIYEQTYWFPHSYTVPKSDEESVFLLPAFDEFIISYRDRSASLLPEYKQRAISRNGIFWPVIVIDGQVQGLWRRTVKNNTVVVETDLFGQLPTATKRTMEEKAITFGEFIGKKTEVSHRCTL